MQMIARRAGSVPFDPFYDPMTARGLGPGSDYAPTYWIDTAGPACSFSHTDADVEHYLAVSEEFAEVATTSA